MEAIHNILEFIVKFVLNFGIWIVIGFFIYYLAYMFNKKFGDTTLIKYIAIKIDKFCKFLSQYEKWKIYTVAITIYISLNFLFGNLLYHELINETFGVIILLVINIPLILFAIIGMPIF